MARRRGGGFRESRGYGFLYSHETERSPGLGGVLARLGTGRGYVR